ncbi:MAG: DDE-type integrase/transposase/recombinase [Moraxellaceae bacterium]|nr:DDE-type integrase/transposase/recombinase [Moraxellaceae bacterium]MDZ4386578.1 DDE-type integrase/transposase/recombinase [Moraxellaceae bacterium]
MSNLEDEYSIEDEAYKPRRERVDLSVGTAVLHENLVYAIKEIVDYNIVLCVELDSGRSKLLRVEELRPAKEMGSDNAIKFQDLDEITDEDWRVAHQRYKAIEPLIAGSPGRAQIEKRAQELGTSASTIYRWLRLYKSMKVLSALIPKQRGWVEGKHRINEHVEEVISTVITDYYLTLQRPVAQKAVLEVINRCHKRGLEPPHPNTVRDRISKISEREHLRKRGFREKAKNKFTPVPGRFPNADFPLSVVQIDHTQVDIILVDDVHRKPISRPWITLAVDVYSRMVTGYYLSFDPPSETSVAMCVAHSILPKKEWMLMHDVDADWPVWGAPRTIHVDNGADFRSEGFSQSCLQYGINLEFRPVKQPRYGGHIERLLGTLMREVHTLPGTTFSSVKSREGYDSEKNAVMTKSEFEGWLVSFICKVYHSKTHSSLGVSPARKWEIGIFGNQDIVGVGLPDHFSDRHTVLLDFLPRFRRTIQPFGVTVDNLTYYAEALRPWIGAVDKSQDGKKREFIFRRDPRDVSLLWFFEPELKQYFKVPLADQSIPTMSIWEYELARSELKKQGANSFSTSQLVCALDDMRQRVEKASESTKRARRTSQRQKEHAKKINPATPAKVFLPSPEVATATHDLLESGVVPFGDIS